MSIMNKYILEYSNGFAFELSEHVSKKVLNVEIEIDIFEYRDQCNHREKAHAVFKNRDLTYECELCEEHNYDNCFYPVVLNGKSYICFRKTLYGFTLISVDTLTVEYEYFPEAVLRDEESFIITDTHQLDNIIIFEGCYWACPYGCFAFDFESKRFLDVSDLIGIKSLELNKVLTNNGKLIIYASDEKDSAIEFSLSKAEIMTAMDQNGQSDF